MPLADHVRLQVPYRREYILFKEAAIFLPRVFSAGDTRRFLPLVKETLHRQPGGFKFCRSTFGFETCQLQGFFSGFDLFLLFKVFD